MRIIAGKFGGRKIQSVPDSALRPAMGKTREALFSMIEARGIVWEKSHVLDLFAGSGSLGLECLSRGAAEAVLVDNGAATWQCAARNLADFDPAGLSRAIRQDVLRYLRAKPARPFNLVFIDPPYGRNLANPVLAALARGDWLAPGAFVVAEIEKQAEIVTPDNLLPLAERHFGQTCLRIWENS